MDELSRKINFLLKLPKSYIPKAEYVFRTYCKVLGLQPQFFYEETLEDVSVYYGSQSSEKYPVEIYYSERAADYFSKTVPYPQDDFHFVQYRRDNIPFIFSIPGKIYQYNPKHLVIRKDIIASSFFFLSCWEEYVWEINNKGKPFPYENTLPVVWDFSEIPVVNKYCDIFQKALENVLPGFQKQKNWPENKDLAVSIAHFISFDRDEEGRVKSKAGIANVQHSKLTKTINRLLSENTLLKLVKKKKKEVVSPTIFIPHAKLGTDAKPAKTIPALLLAGINDKSIGVFSNEILNAKELDESAIYWSEQGFNLRGFCVLGYDNHYHKLFEQLKDSRILFDLSVNYSKTTGFRAGTSFPYYPFNIKENKPFSVLEIPLAINNRVFPHLQARKKYIRNHIQYMIADAVAYRNHIALIWQYSSELKGSLTLTYYQKIITQFAKKNAWLCSLQSIYDNWLNR